MARMTGATGVQTNRTDIQLPEAVASEILEKTQEASAVMRLARRVDLPGNGLQIPVIVNDPEASWVAETAAKPVSNPEISKKIMQAYKLAVIVPFSMEFRRDAARLYDELIRRLPNALGAKYDATVFHGAAPGSNFDTFANASAQSIAGTATYTGLVAAVTDIATHGGDMNGIALAPQGKGILLTATDDNKRPLFINSVSEGAVDRVLGAPVVASKAAYKAGSGSGSSAVPAVVGIAGDWTQALYGTVEGVTIGYSEDATLVVGSGNSATTINLFQQNMFAVRAEIEVGFVADTTVFNKLTA